MKWCVYALPPSLNPPCFVVPCSVGPGGGVGTERLRVQRGDYSDRDGRPL